VAGAVLTVGMNTQRAMELRQDLASALPSAMHGFSSTDIEVSAEEIRVAGVSSYLMREFRPAGDDGAAIPSPIAADGDAPETAAASFSVYVGYYDSQTQGRTIHSPKNCLPGAGWEPLQSRQVMLETPTGSVPANRYLLQRGEQRALVVYWYQGRGRVEANEYLVKVQLLRDAALRGRSEEALVRIVVPIVSDEENAFRIAADIAETLVPSVDLALPIG
jgi:EpsI family protein